MMDQDEAEAQQTPRTLKQLKCENEQKRKAINEVQRKLERLQEEERELEAQIAENKARIDELMGLGGS
ncbi:hypothetical protein DQ04_03891020 [Trypanosoma grayi]|uniref:hypothetical protein n=1 Tax=Trypanosoma grayi TaxID=71804 RepID=UPI0004F3F545|nr:hypothetical protein DQ04_03891020 [Trypanosoma grayi]KEG10313.1 hypothetical protein DQ04_03891020 [Trypanosoma grayi]